MSSSSKHSSSLVYVHGTNGSGKSTLARAVLAAAGGPLGVQSLPANPKATWTPTASAGVVLVGRYGNACGGVDGLQPYASIHDVLQANQGHRVLAEGLVTPGVDTCKAMAATADQHLFIFLDIPAEQCIQNVLKRRTKKGTTKPYDPANLYRKRDSAASWARRLKDAGLNVKMASWAEAYLLCLDALGLPVPDADKLF